MPTLSISFTTTQGLPKCPDGQRLRSIDFKTCPGKELDLRVVLDVDPVLDLIHGVPADSWWVIRSPDLPDRSLRLYQGAHSLSHLLRRYGFLDASGCLHHSDAIAHYSTATPLPAYALQVPKELRDSRGVPQFHPSSGVCWFAAMCWTMLANTTVRNFVTSKMPSNLKRACDRCLSQHQDAQEVRRILWDKYEIGDNITRPPEEDGCNGFTEFARLCATLGVPMVILHIDNRGNTTKECTSELRDPDPGETHLLVTRYQDGDHHDKQPMRRRIEYTHTRRSKSWTVRYRLVGVYMGHRRCGHQIGACSPSGGWRDWSISDADLHKDGIGPIFFYFRGRKWRDGWWNGWRELVHVTKFGLGLGKLCNLSPHNERDDMLERPGEKLSHKPGSLSIDLVYLSEP